jgi:hypothetical protein
MIRDGDGHMKAAEKSDKFEQEALAAIKQLMLDLVGPDASGDHEIAEGVRQYQAELRTKIQAL